MPYLDLQRVFPSNPAPVANAPSENVEVLTSHTVIYDNARCYSAIAYWHGITAAPSNLSGTLIEAWLSSPLVRALGAEPPKRGDILTMAEQPARIPLDHVAVLHDFDTNGDARYFHKPGAPSEAGFDFATKPEIDAIYPGSVTKHFRVEQSFSSYLMTLSRSAGRDGALAYRLHAELGRLESRIARFTVIPSENRASEPDGWADAFDAELSSVKQAAARIKETIDRSLARHSHVPEFVWTILTERVGAIDTTGGPYDG